MEAGVDRNHRMELQYDGTGLHGWAKQDGLSTVEGSLEKALRTVLGFAPELQVAGRTDAGVHARRQIVSLRLPPGTDLTRLRASLNALTPPGIAVMRLTLAPQWFNARKDASSRLYRYYVSLLPVASPFTSRYSWHVLGAVDLAVLREAAAVVVGRHDFRAFTPTETEHVFFDRLVARCAWKRAVGSAPGAGLSTGAPGVSRARGVGDGTQAPGSSQAAGLFYLEIEAEAFLRHMVRALVGTMMEMAQGRRSPDDFKRLLRGATRNEAGPTAPPHGLFLWDVTYRRGRQCKNR
jgi:tRNA pseudouridine38-40 synthase